ncbi:MAG: caspase family protein [Nitrososphaerota archaeon]
MPVAILIIFSYESNPKKFLPSAPYDFNYVYQWCKNFSTTFIITDMDINMKSIKSNMIIINSYEDLLTGIYTILSKEIDFKLFIYYSGHGVHDSMVLPDNSLLPFVNLKRYIVEIIPEYTEIFWVLDCCNPNGLNLPCKLQGERFVLSPNKVEFILQPVLLITSSDSNEKSMSTKNGSLFTKYFFQHLLLMDKNSKIKEKNRNLRHLITTLTNSIKKDHPWYSQTISVYCSYFMDPLLWTWIGSKKNYDIVPDITMSTLVIRY